MRRRGCGGGARWHGPCRSSRWRRSSCSGDAGGGAEEADAGAAGGRRAGGSSARGVCSSGRPHRCGSSVGSSVDTTGNCMECRRLCRVHNIEHSAKLLFAECLRKTLGKQTTLGGRKLCRVPATWHSAKPHFAECINEDTRRTHLCRVPRGQHLATSVTCATQARTRLLQRGRHYSLPSALIRMIRRYHS